jgi:hypothetical protein
MKANGASLGICQPAPSQGATGCATAGEVCGEGANYMGGQLPTCGGECCSRACFPYGPTGVLVCQPPSGCKPTGELCREDSDCCGLPCVPVPGSEGDLICGSGCIDTGSACTNDADCCAGLPCTNGVCGTTQGCSSYGQTCDATHLCCNGVPCTNGVCADIIQ